MSSPRSGKGRVILVGAGPGDPDLITVRGANALREADAVVYDALAPPELLDLAPPEAKLYNVGKRGHDPPTRTQPEINALLLKLAFEGKSVVRLKGGDPLVFGRGGEEITACVEAGIEFEIVPGISSVNGALAYAGIPLTDRRYAASFAVVTGHKDPTRVARETRWEELATSVDTLVILMGMRNLEDLVDRLIAAGRDPDTAAAVVMNGTLPAQRVLRAPLAELVRRAREAGLGAPAAVVIGDVVRLRESMAWFERRPLFGKRVLVTRDKSQCGGIIAALREVGAEAVVEPMIRLVPPADFAAVDAALDAIETYDAMVVTSANAVRFLAARAEERGVSLFPRAMQVLCLGPQTAEATRKAGIPVHRIPESRYDAEGLLQEILKHLPPKGLRFLFPRAEVAREVLPDGLRAAGASVDEVVAYRNLPPEIDAAGFRARLAGGEFDALTFTSPSTVKNFAALLDDESRAAAARCIIGAIGRVTAHALRGEGLDPDVVPERASVPDLVAALAARISESGTGGAA